MMDGMEICFACKRSIWLFLVELGRHDGDIAVSNASLCNDLVGYFLDLICFAFQNQVFHAVFVIQVNMGVDHHDIANSMLHGC